MYLKSTRMNHVNRASLPSDPNKRTIGSNSMTNLDVPRPGTQSRIRKGVSVAQLSTMNNQSYYDTDMMISRYMDVHNQKVTRLLGLDEK